MFKSSQRCSRGIRRLRWSSPRPENLPFDTAGELLFRLRLVPYNFGWWWPLSWFCCRAVHGTRQEMWAELGKSGDVDANLLESIRTCYAEKMKPVVSDEQLAALRRRYDIRVEA